MPIKSLIKETLSLQGFRVDSIDRFSFGLNIKIIPDRRYRPRCGKCGHTGKYRDTRPKRQFKHVPLWGLPVFLSYSPRRVVCKYCGGVYFGHLGQTFALDGGSPPFSLCLGNCGLGR